MPKESTPGKGRAHRGHLRIFGLAILNAIGGFPVAYQFVEQAPPRKIVIATGDKSGAYYAFAQRYKKVLARDGITLEIRSTAGSGENLKLLTERENGVDIALVQGGMFRAEIVNPPKKFGLAWRNWIKLKMKFFMYPSSVLRRLVLQSAGAYFFCQEILEKKRNRFPRGKRIGLSKKGRTGGNAEQQR